MCDLVCACVRVRSCVLGHWKHADSDVGLLTETKIRSQHVSSPGVFQTCHREYAQFRKTVMCFLNGVDLFHGEE